MDAFDSFARDLFSDTHDVKVNKLYSNYKVLFIVCLFVRLFCLAIEITIM